MNSLLPPNSTLQEAAIEAATARIGDVGTPLRDLWNPQTCPEPLLPWLAWALSIDSWKSYWPIEIKRARVAAALAIQRRKGTSQSVRDVISSFGGSVDIVEWWQQTPPGAPHTFRVNVAIASAVDAENSAAFTDDLIAEVSRTKPVRSHFDFTQSTSFRGGVGVAAVVRACTYARLPLTAEAA